MGEYKKNSMERLKEITLDRLEKLLPSDVREELITHCIKRNLYLPKIRYLNILFSDALSVCERHEGNLGCISFKNIIEEFISTFPMIAIPIEDVQEFIFSILNGYRDTFPFKIISDYINIMDKDGYTFISYGYNQRAGFIYKLNNVYYTFSLDEFNDFSIHQSIIKFFEEREIPTVSCVTLCKF